MNQPKKFNFGFPSKKNPKTPEETKRKTTESVEGPNKKTKSIEDEDDLFAIAGLGKFLQKKKKSFYMLTHFCF